MEPGNHFRFCDKLVPQFKQKVIWPSFEWRMSVYVRKIFFVVYHQLPFLPISQKTILNKWNSYFPFLYFINIYARNVWISIYRDFKQISLPTRSILCCNGKKKVIYGEGTIQMLEDIQDIFHKPWELRVHILSPKYFQYIFLHSLFPFTFEYKKDDYVKARKYSETCIICHCCCKMLQAYLSFKTPFHFSFIFLSQSVNNWKYYYQAFVYFTSYEFILYLCSWLKV